MSWLTQLIKDVLLGILFSFVLIISNALVSVLVVFLVFTMIADMNLFFGVPILPEEAQLHCLTLLGMNALIIALVAGGTYAYKLATLFNNIDFSFNKL